MVEADDADWNVGWDDNARRQRAGEALATPAQRLAWLEEAIRFAHATGALPRPRGADGRVIAAPGQDDGG